LCWLLLYSLFWRWLSECWQFVSLRPSQVCNWFFI
jgi:hypothetical protein